MAMAITKQVYNTNPVNSRYFQGMAAQVVLYKLCEGTRAGSLRRDSNGMRKSGKNLKMKSIGLSRFGVGTMGQNGMGVVGKAALRGMVGRVSTIDTNFNTSMFTY